jgi:hypothetical protein
MDSAPPPWPIPAPLTARIEFDAVDKALGSAPRA